jgi:hypothetical protein
MRRSIAGVLLAWVAATGACVDAPSAPSSEADENILASSFDALSRDALQKGDVERSQEFVWAALAIRGGTVPSKLQITTNGAVESYDAMVHAVTWTLSSNAQRAGTNRTLLAWRREGTNLKTWMIGSSTDQAQVLHPASAGPGTTLLSAPFAGAHVLYSVRGAQSGTWVGVGGGVRMVAGIAGEACTPPAGDKAPNGVTCTQIKYGVAFDLTIQPASADTRLPDNASSTVRATAAEQQVNGARLTLSCANPKSGSGC